MVVLDSSGIAGIFLPRRIDPQLYSQQVCDTIRAHRHSSTRSGETPAAAYVTRTERSTLPEWNWQSRPRQGIEYTPLGAQLCIRLGIRGSLFTRGPQRNMRNVAGKTYWFRFLSPALLAAVAAVFTCVSATAATPAASPILPAYDFQSQRPLESLSAPGARLITAIRVHGYTVLTQGEIAELIAPYQNRSLQFREILELRDVITQRYVEQGYVTSGAVIEGINGKVLSIRVVEGDLTEIRVVGERRLRPEYVTAYLERFEIGQPVNVYNIEERLQIFQQQPYLDRVEAQLLPGREKGESILQVRPVEIDSWRALFEVSNALNPSIGSVQGIVSLDFGNLAGRTDNLHLGYRGAEGLNEFDAEYDFPVGAGGARLVLYAFGADSDIVTSPFDELDISANSWTAGTRLRLPLERTVAGDTTLEFSAEWRRSKTYLLGSGFSFVEGPDEGVAKLAIVRSALEHLRRTQQDVFYTRLELSTGLHLFGSTDSNDGSVPDSQFLKLHLQSQWARRLNLFESQAIVRVDGQISNDPLLGLEQFPIGGRWTVRGYRENSLIRDNAIVASAEWRIPLVRDERGVSRFEIRPFFDWSYSDNKTREALRRNTLSAVGLGLFWSPIDNLQAEVYWGEPLQTVEYPGDYSLQDDGIFFSLTWGTR